MLLLNTDINGGHLMEFSLLVSTALLALRASQKMLHVPLDAASILDYINP